MLPEDRDYFEGYQAALDYIKEEIDRLQHGKVGSVHDVFLDLRNVLAEAKLNTAVEE